MWHPGRLSRTAGVAALFGLTALTAMAGQHRVLAQNQGTVILTIDAPSNGAEIAEGQPVVIGGWAVDPGKPGTGVSSVDVFLDAPQAPSGTFVGPTRYGLP